MKVKRYPYTDADGVLHIRYQDKYTFGSTVSEIRKESITSTVAGTDQRDERLLVPQADGKSVYADGCGTATVLLADGEVRIKVDPSPINILFVTGQSNASGDPAGGLKPGYAEQYTRDYIRSPETMAYLTWTGQRVSVDVEQDKADYRWAWENGGTLWPSDPPESVRFVDYKKYVPKTLDWETAKNEMGPPPGQLSLPPEKTSFITCGWNAALAYEWVKQTGERVWIVNCAQGGMEIQHFLPNESGRGTNEYYQAVAVFNLALETLYREVDAGHFVLHHILYYWFHGESNSDENTIGMEDYRAVDNRFMKWKGNRYLTAEEYDACFRAMHAAFMRDVVYDHAGVRKELELCGIMTIRAYNDGKRNTLEHLKMVGPRAAEYHAGIAPDGVLKNVFVVSNVTERWVGPSFDEALDTNPGADAAVQDYFTKTYGSPEKFREIFGYDLPKTAYQLRPGCHYLMHGHNEMGMDCARNSLRILALLDPENAYDLPDYEMEDQATVRLLSEDGLTELTDTVTFDKSTRKATVCPIVTPLYQQVKGVRIEPLGEGFSFSANVFTADAEGISPLRFKLYLGEKLYGEYAFSVEYR